MRSLFIAASTSLYRMKRRCPAGHSSVERWGPMEATVNVQGFEELKRILANVPEGQLDMTNWNSCACGHATRD